jgi:hypothetical protein
MRFTARAVAVEFFDCFDRESIRGAGRFVEMAGPDSQASRLPWGQRGRRLTKTNAVSAMSAVIAAPVQ